MGSPAFDPSKPYEPVAQAAKPVFDPSKPYEPAQTAQQRDFDTIPNSNESEKQKSIAAIPEKVTSGKGFPDDPVANYVYKNPGQVGAAAATALFPAEGLLGPAAQGLSRLGKIGRFAQVAGTEAGVAGTGAAAATAGKGIAEGQDAGTVAGESAKQGLEQGAFMGAGRVGMGALGKVADAGKYGAKAASGAISQAAERLGIDKVPGMLADSPMVQGLEKGLVKAKGLIGNGIQDAYQKIGQKLKGVANDIFSTASSADKQLVGEQVSKGMMGDIGSQYNQVQMMYEPFNQELPKMIPEMTDKFKLANDVAEAYKGKFSLKHDLEGYGRKVSNNVMEAKTLADFENIRQQVGSDLRASGDENAREALSKIQEHLSNFRDDQFVKLAKESGPPGQGAKYGQQMVEEYHQAQSSYAKMAQDLRSTGSLLGIKARNPKAFLEAFENIPDQKLSSTLFDAKDEKSLQAFKDAFPDHFETLKNQKLAEFRDVYDKNPNSFLLRFNKLSGQAQDMIFGAPNVQKIKDMQTIYSAIPEGIDVHGISAERGFGKEAVGEAVNSGIHHMVTDGRGMLNKVGNFAKAPGAGMIPSAAVQGAAQGVGLLKPPYQTRPINKGAGNQ